MAAMNRKRTTDARGLAVVILAAGEGKRMRSEQPKVLHEVGGKPLVLHVLDAADQLRPKRTVVVIGSGAEQVRDVIGSRGECVVQQRRLGTGHAVLQAKSALARFRGDVVVLCGDVPLMRASTLKKLVSKHRRGSALASVLSMTVEDPTGYGRIVRDGVLRIVEHADATSSELYIDEVNTATYCFDARFLFDALGTLESNNAQREYYLTDLVEMAAKRGKAVCEQLADADEGIGVNSRRDLATAECALQERLIEAWMDAGVTFLDPSSVFVGTDVLLSRDCIVGPNVVLAGSTRVGTGCRFDGASWVRDTIVERGTHVRWGVVADGARIGKGARVGPYAHLRPAAELAEDVHVGNFVEVKNASIGPRSKANHLSYIGDATVGRDANVGAGTITCNYDGFRKHRTVIGDRVQIGSDTQLVAPVSLGADSYIAAGSTVTRDVPAWALAMNDKKQLTRLGWVKAFRARARKDSAPPKRRRKA
jgi:bifunctional UDP-N-acetylglucosamine pyrophosphorylase/glucosamine-1-phosphate N-acetyltransferase